MPLIKEIGEDELLARSALEFIRARKMELMADKFRTLFTLEQREQMLKEAEASRTK